MLSRCYLALRRTREADLEQRVFDAMQEDVSLDGLRQRYLNRHPEMTEETLAGHEHRIN
jgi:hypothetical protein